ncbi:VOC family protein [Pseudonocardia nigra]|uniref:VOC family protein n=1 Tax=Pseudonocardia nigra TaxID=1921578 RepID=UPI001C6023AF
MTFYIGLFTDGRVHSIDRYGQGEPGPEGRIRQAVFTVAGQQLRCIDSLTAHEFGFTPSVSLFVSCTSREEQEKLWAGLAEGGTPLMPLDDYGVRPVRLDQRPVRRLLAAQPGLNSA